MASKKDPIKSLICAFVIGAHLLLMAAALLGTAVKQKKSHKPLIVRSVSPKSSVVTEKRPPAIAARAPAAAPQPKPIAAKPTPKPVENKPVPVPVPVQKKSPPPKVASTQPVAAKKPTPKEKKIAPPPQPVQPRIPDKLLQELEETLAKIEDKSDKSRLSSRKTAKSSGLAPIRLQIDAVESLSIDDYQQEEGDYASILSRHLHQTLHLPDFGEVKIELTLRQDGSVITLKVLKTESEKNRQYLESHLTRLRFPPLEGPFAKKKQCTFVLTFCNEL